MFLIEFYTGKHLTTNDFFAKLDEEVLEARIACHEAGLREYHPRSVDDFASEIFDVMQVCYTYLSTMFDASEIEEFNKQHLRKLRSRNG